MDALIKKTWRPYPGTFTSRMSLSSLVNKRYIHHPREDTDDALIYCYHDEIPGDIEAELEHLYGTIFSSLKKLRLTGDTYGTSTYVAVKDGANKSIYFKRKNSLVQVCCFIS